MWEALARCTMRSAWARMARASSAGVAVAVLTIPLHGAREAVGEAGGRPPPGGLAEPRDFGLEGHDLIGPLRNGAEPQGQGRLGEVADCFHAAADRHAAAAAETADTV